MSDSEEPFVHKSDAAFLYVLFTFQFGVGIYGGFKFFRKLCGSKEYQKENKVSPVKLIVLAILILVNGFWMHHTVKLIDIDNEMKDHSFNPFDHLELSQPTILRNGFNTPEVKKVYRSLARKFHPDKLRHLPDDERKVATKRWQNIVKSYETLTNEVKFKNWMEFGNPDGSVIAQSFDIALPSWITDPENSVFVLCLLFFFCVVMPISVILFTKLDNDPMNIKRFRNGISKESMVLMQEPLFEILA